MSIKSAPLLKSILNDSELTRPEKRLLRCLVGMWGKGNQYEGLVKMIEEKYYCADTSKSVKWLTKTFQLKIGLATLSDQCSYSRESNTIARLIRQLIKKGYIVKYEPGNGVAGQQKNISQLSAFDVRFPSSYDLPEIVKVTKSEKIAMAINTLKREAGLDPHDLQMQVASAEKARAVMKAAPSNRLAYWREVWPITKKIDALKAKRSAAFRDSRGGEKHHPYVSNPKGFC